MTNGEKYKTAEERRIAFNNMCESHKDCTECRMFNYCCEFLWLELKAEESEVAK